MAQQPNATLDGFNRIDNYSNNDYGFGGNGFLDYFPMNRISTPAELDNMKLRLLRFLTNNPAAVLPVAPPQPPAQPGQAPPVPPVAPTI